MARHHASKRMHHGHHLSHAESEKMLRDKEMKEGGRHMSRARYHEHAGMERKMHGLHHSDDTLRHERDSFNDEFHHNAEPEGSGPYLYDRTSKDGMESRRHKEMREAGMIHEDPRQIANLPQEVRMESYPKCGPWTPEDIDDTMRGVDRQIDYDDSKKMQHFFPKKV